MLGAERVGVGRSRLIQQPPSDELLHVSDKDAWIQLAIQILRLFRPTSPPNEHHQHERNAKTVSTAAERPFEWTRSSAGRMTGASPDLSRAARHQTGEQAAQQTE